MALWVKICGLTTADAVDAAVHSGADAIGFVFAPSKRRVSPAEARALSAGVPTSIAKVAVMLHPSQAELEEVLAGFTPDVLQTDATDLERLRLPQQLVTMPVYRDVCEPHLLSAAERILFEGAVSGSGTPANWECAANLTRKYAVVLAGGLTIENVSEAVRRVRPFGVDVSSGVEASPGRKDPRKIQEFIRAARNAAHSLGH